ncbi:MAG: hypothetical protein WCJ87_12075 [Burkholderiales bacterium]
MSIEGQADAVALLRSGSQVALILSDRGAVAGVERQFNVACVITNTSGDLRAGRHGLAELRDPVH